MSSSSLDQRFFLTHDIHFLKQQITHHHAPSEIPINPSANRQLLDLFASITHLRNSHLLHGQKTLHQLAANLYRPATNSQALQTGNVSQSPFQSPPQPPPQPHRPSLLLNLIPNHPVTPLSAIVTTETSIRLANRTVHDIGASLNAILQAVYILHATATPPNHLITILKDVLNTRALLLKAFVTTPSPDLPPDHHLRDSRQCRHICYKEAIHKATALVAIQVFANLLHFSQQSPLDIRHQIISLLNHQLNPLPIQIRTCTCATHHLPFQVQTTTSSPSLAICDLSQCLHNRPTTSDQLQSSSLSPQDLHHYTNIVALCRRHIGDVLAQGLLVQSQFLNMTLVDQTIRWVYKLVSAWAWKVQDKVTEETLSGKEASDGVLSALKKAVQNSSNEEALVTCMEVLTDLPELGADNHRGEWEISDLMKSAAGGDTDYQALLVKAEAVAIESIIAYAADTLEAEFESGKMEASQKLEKLTKVWRFLSNEWSMVYRRVDGSFGETLRPAKEEVRDMLLNWVGTWCKISDKSLEDAAVASFGLAAIMVGALDEECGSSGVLRRVGKILATKYGGNPLTGEGDRYRGVVLDAVRERMMEAVNVLVKYLSEFETDGDFGDLGLLKESTWSCEAQNWILRLALSRVRYLLHSPLRLLPLASSSSLALSGLSPTADGSPPAHASPPADASPPIDPLPSDALIPEWVALVRVAFIKAVAARIRTNSSVALTDDRSVVVLVCASNFALLQAIADTSIEKSLSLSSDLIASLRAMEQQTVTEVVTELAEKSLLVEFSSDARRYFSSCRSLFYPLVALQSSCSDPSATSTTQPEAVGSTTQPEAVGNTTQPEAVDSTTQPEAVGSTTQPEAVGSTTQPAGFESEGSRIAADAALDVDGKSTSRRQRPYFTVLPLVRPENNEDDSEEARIAAAGALGKGGLKAEGGTRSFSFGGLFMSPSSSGTSLLNQFTPGNESGGAIKSTFKAALSSAWR